MTVPASSSVLDNTLFGIPLFLYTLLKVSPVNKIDRYCSPINTFTPIAVAAVAMITDRTLINFSWGTYKIVGTIPVTNNNPPNPKASITREMVKNMLLIPPFVRSSLTGSKLVEASYPSNQIEKIAEKDKSLVIRASIVAIRLLMASETNAESLNTVHRTKIIKGSHDVQ